MRFSIDIGIEISIIIYMHHVQLLEPLAKSTTIHVSLLTPRITIFFAYYDNDTTLSGISCF